MQKALEGRSIHSNYQQTVQYFLRKWINHQEMDAYLQIAFLLNLTPSQLLRLNSFFQAPKLSLAIKTALPETDIQNMLRTINQNLREQITELQIEFAKDIEEDFDSMTKEEQDNIPPLSIEDLAQDFMEVNPALLNRIFQDDDFVPTFPQLEQILNAGIDMYLFFKEIESSQDFANIFEAVSQSEEPAIIIKDEEEDKLVSQEETSISDNFESNRYNENLTSKAQSYTRRPS